MNDWDWLLEDYGPDGDIARICTLADALEQAGMVHEAASAWNRAYGLNPEDASIAQRRQTLLDALSIEVSGLAFRYIPAGSFLMGAHGGDPDEAPVHPVRLDAYWIQEMPLSWHDFERIMAWENGVPPGSEVTSSTQFTLYENNKIRFQYCIDGTQHIQNANAFSNTTPELLRTLFGAPDGSGQEIGHQTKPMVAVSWRSILSFAERLTAEVEGYSAALPTEAEWEKAARGGLIGKRYPWGDALPTPAQADFDHFGVFAIRPPRELIPNGFGLYGSAGGVWEWCSDWYDTEAYAKRVDTSAVYNPQGPARGVVKVLRGGSWSDCAAALRVSFRSALRARDKMFYNNPNIGARLVLRRR